MNKQLPPMRPYQKWKVFTLSQKLKESMVIEEVHHNPPKLSGTNAEKPKLHIRYYELIYNIE